MEGTLEQHLEDTYGGDGDGGAEGGRGGPRGGRARERASRGLGRVGGWEGPGGVRG